MVSREPTYAMSYRGVSYWGLGQAVAPTAPVSNVDERGETVLTEVQLPGVPTKVKVTALTVAAAVSILFAAYNVFIASPRHFKRIEKRLGLAG
jgi:hypothetical protein